jgi:hypothetical protein
MNNKNEKIVNEISQAVTGLEYGSVLIKVHDSKIVQVEITERKRFDEFKVEKGGGIYRLYYQSKGNAAEGPWAGIVAF